MSLHSVTHRSRRSLLPELLNGKARKRMLGVPAVLPCACSPTARNTLLWRYGCERRQYDFGAKPEYKNGEKIQYTVREDELEKYTARISGFTTIRRGSTTLQ